MPTITFQKIRRKIDFIFHRSVANFHKKRILVRMRKWRPRYGLNKTAREERVIVSLTSYPPRFATIGPTLKSLLWQTVKPDEIIVWLSCGPEDITEEMHSYEQYGITFRYHVSDYKSHKKYYFAFKEFPDDVVITVDDDAMYPHDLVDSLLRVHRRYPGCVCARKVHQITWDEAGKINGYEKWNQTWRRNRHPSGDLVAIGVGGVLYPPHWSNDQVFDSALFTELASNQDDLWLKWMESLAGVDVVWVPNGMTDPPQQAGSQSCSLNEKNVHQGGNDVAISALSDRFGPMKPSRSKSSHS